MIVMLDESRQEAITSVDTPTNACDLHGRSWTGNPVGEDESTGVVAVLQYVHPDWEQVSEKHVTDFSGEKTCSMCGDPTSPMPLWLAERILRMHPQLVTEEGYRWEGICDECAHDHGCPHCGDETDEHTH